jgi:UDP-N-acetylmuramoyl-tripeptide--D-alanyl-D-alanine ligase
MFQLEGYRPSQYLPWLYPRVWSEGVLPAHWVGIVLALLLTIASGLQQRSWLVPVLVVAWAITFGSARRYRTERVKKRLAFTSRMLRLAAVAGAVSLAFVFAGVLLEVTRSTKDVLWYYLGWFTCNLFIPLTVSIAGVLTGPFERRVHEGFKDQARARLASIPHLKTIGITGSYGKTSVKFILAEILSGQFSALATPGSYNTPMGICKVINNDLQFGHHILILEMGARYRGDIRELCEIAAPDISILTSIGVAHLETLGSVENILATKSEIVKHMKPGGTVVLNADDRHLADFAVRLHHPVIQVSAEGNEADLTARDIDYDRNGTSFEVVTADGDACRFTTGLLGTHNVTNILLGLAVGHHLGIGLRQMAHNVRRLEPVEHRLQLRSQGDVTVIDDSFNSNPIGARNAIDVLSSFSGGRRIIVTPGMVELGDRQTHENRELGVYMAHRVDLAVLIGRQQSRPIMEGLLKEGHPESDVRQFDSFFDAQEFLNSFLRPGDVVLYENDLPDQYEETRARGAKP